MKLNVTHVRLDHIAYTGHVCRCVRPQDKLSIYSLLVCWSVKHELNIARESQAWRSLKALRLTICQYERSLHHVIIVPNLKNRHEAWKLCNQHLPWRLTHTAQFLHSNTQKTWNAQSPMIWKHCTNKWSYYDTEAKQVSHPKNRCMLSNNATNSRLKHTCNNASLMCVTPQNNKLFVLLEIQV